MKITWELLVDKKDLKKQRRVLEKLLYDWPVSKKERDNALEGVLSLLEALQDKIDDAAKTKKACTDYLSPSFGKGI